MVMDVTKTDQQLIDVHAHFLTDAYVTAARDAGHIHPDGMAGWPHWSAEEHLRLMDRWGVATAMLSIFPRPVPTSAMMPRRAASRGKSTRPVPRSLGITPAGSVTSPRCPCPT